MKKSSKIASQPIVYNDSIKTRSVDLTQSQSIEEEPQVTKYFQTSYVDTDAQ
jgi:hypothetical protein